MLKFFLIFQYLSMRLICDIVLLLFFYKKYHQQYQLLSCFSLENFLFSLFACYIYPNKTYKLTFICFNISCALFRFASIIDMISVVSNTGASSPL